MKRIVALFLLMCLMLFGQSTQHYFMYRSLTGTANSITIRQPNSSGRGLQVVAISFECSVDCTWQVSKNGTVSGGSSGTIQLLDESTKAATASATLDGTVSGSTTVSGGDIVGPGVRDLDGGLTLPFASGSPRQFTVSLTSGSSGDLSIILYFDELGR